MKPKHRELQKLKVNKLRKNIKLFLKKLKAEQKGYRNFCVDVEGKIFSITTMQVYSPAEAVRCAERLLTCRDSIAYRFILEHPFLFPRKIKTKKVQLFRLKTCLLMSIGTGF